MSLVSGELSEVLGIPFDDLKDELFAYYAPPQTGEQTN